MKPKVKTSLCIWGDVLNFNDITSDLNVFPTKIRYRDEFPEISKKMGFAKDEWIYSTQKKECNSISTQIDELEKTFENSADKLNEVCKRYSAKITITIMIEAEVGGHPELFLTRENIKFLSSIDSEVGIDPYIYNSEE